MLSVASGNSRNEEHRDSPKESFSTKKLVIVFGNCVSRWLKVVIIFVIQRSSKWLVSENKEFICVLLIAAQCRLVSKIVLFR